MTITPLVGKKKMPVICIREVLRADLHQRPVTVVFSRHVQLLVLNKLRVPLAYF